MSVPDRFALRICLLLIRIAARIVPTRDREAWEMEWEAELRYRWSPRVTISRRGEMHMVRRSFGAVMDAAWIRRQFTLDADVVHDADVRRRERRDPGGQRVELLRAGAARRPRGSVDYPKGELAPAN